jgi:hypothetical protein
MKAAIFSIICAWSIMSNAQLTYIPDDAFELFVETYVPSASNGNPNDNYVNTEALNNYNGISFSGALDINPQSVPSAVISDFTGLEDFTSIGRLFITSMSMTDLNISNLSNTYTGGGYLTVNISSCNILEEISLPQNNISVNIQVNPLLQRIHFQNSNVFYGLNHIEYNNTIETIDISNTSGVNNQAWFFVENLNLKRLNLKNGHCNNWVQVLIQENVCVMVDDPAYAAIAWFAGDPSAFDVTLSTNCSTCLASAEEQSAIGFQVNPNPSSGKFVVESSLSLAKESYFLYDTYGRLINTGVLNGKEDLIQINAGTGIYYLKIRDEVVKVQVLK